MAGVETTWVWSIGIIAFAFGLVVGYVISYYTNPDHTRRQALEQELAQLKEEADQYRGQVSQHFRRTSELVQEMTDSYRNVYEHLATGSQQLCSDPVSTPRLDLPERERLASEAKADATTTAAESPADTAVTEPPVAAETEAQNGQDDYLGDAPHVPDLNLHLVHNETKAKTGTDKD